MKTDRIKFFKCLTIRKYRSKKYFQNCLFFPVYSNIIKPLSVNFLRKGREARGERGKEKGERREEKGERGKGKGERGRRKGERRKWGNSFAFPNFYIILRRSFARLRNGIS